MNNEEYEHEPKKPENRVIEGIEQNPFKTYKVHFPYQVRFTIDGIENTEIIINTESEGFLLLKNQEGCSIDEGTFRQSFRYKSPQIHYQLSE
jgi:hypothetical protein